MSVSPAGNVLLPSKRTVYLYAHMREREEVRIEREGKNCGEKRKKKSVSET